MSKERNVVSELLGKAKNEAVRNKDCRVEDIQKLIEGQVSESTEKEDKEKIELIVANGKLGKEVEDLRAKLDQAEKLSASAKRSKKNAAEEDN